MNNKNIYTISITGGSLNIFLCNKNRKKISGRYNTKNIFRDRRGLCKICRECKPDKFYGCRSEYRIINDNIKQFIVSYIFRENKLNDLKSCVKLKNKYINYF